MRSNARTEWSAPSTPVGTGDGIFFEQFDQSIHVTFPNGPREPLQRMIYWVTDRYIDDRAV